MYDLVIVGAGAAGLAAAVCAAENGARVCVLEGRGEIGKKLLATGNGRCNLSHTPVCVQDYHGDSEALSPFLAQFSPAFLRQFWQKLGLLTVCDEEGRMYPHSLQAASVLHILEQSARERGVEICTHATVTAIKKDGHFTLFANKDKWEAKACLLSCGGRAAPKLGCGANGYALAKSLGHTSVPTFPALTKLRCPDAFPGTVSGQRARVRVGLTTPDGSREETGEVIFAQNSIGGICIMQLSRLVSAYFATDREAPPLSLHMDFLPDLEEEAVRTSLLALKHSRPACRTAQLLDGMLPLPIAQALTERFALPDKPLSSLFAEELTHLIRAVKDCVFPVSGAFGWEEAQVTAGGIPLAEVDLTTMQSRVCPGLYIAGELLNVDGDCGGYNLHFAFCSGICAGTAAAQTK